MVLISSLELLRSNKVRIEIASLYLPLTALLKTVLMYSLLLFTFAPSLQATE